MYGKLEKNKIFAKGLYDFYNGIMKVYFIVKYKEIFR